MVVVFPVVIGSLVRIAIDDLPEYVIRFLLEELVVDCFHHLDHCLIVCLIQIQPHEGGAFHAHRDDAIKQREGGTGALVVLIGTEGDGKGILLLTARSKTNRSEIQID